MAWAAVAVGGGALVGSILGGGAARDAAAAQEAAARESAQAQLQMYNQTREDQAPWRAAGADALKQLQDPGFQKTFSMSDFAADPGYQYRMSEAQKALSHNAAANGSMFGGNFAKALNQNVQDQASQEYQNAYNRFNNDQSTRFNRLSSIAGLGQTANGQVQQAGQSAANGLSSAYGSIGNAQAAGAIGQANATTNGIGQGLNTWMNYQMMNKFAPAKSGG